MTDPFNLERFVEAQAPVYAQVLAELAQGKKRSHWIWFIFPQVAGLGFSAMAQTYAIGSRGEAVAYLAHAVLGPRLIECVKLVLAVEGRSINSILGSPDDLKFRSSMTLFKSVSENPVFDQALQKFFVGVDDARTLEILMDKDG
jgi:uncharacterized protein (DUF1810 family)